MTMTGVGRKRFLREFPEALHDGAGGIFVGAGVSMAAGYPSWSALLREIGDELGIRSSDIHDLAALAQWHIKESGGATRVRNIIKQEIGKDRGLPETAQILARLPVRHMWTTNYDRTIERAFAAVRRPIDAVSGAKDLSLRATPGATRLYKMHGSVDRLDDIVISTEDYELYRTRRGAFIPLLQAHLSSMSMLFVGLSLSDPNIRHVLSLIRESFTDAPPEHFAILRPPKRTDCSSDEEFDARTAQHRFWSRDLSRYGLVAVEIDDYDELPVLLREVERKVAAHRIWVSGSWPLEDGAGVADRYRLAEELGRMIGATGHDLVSGSGMVVGPAAIAGFVDSLRDGGGWDVDRRLIVRAFSQPLSGEFPGRALWTELRTELARQSGLVIFVGGSKLAGGSVQPADGVIEEYELAKAEGAFLLPLGATGGAAEVIAKDLLGSAVPSAGVSAQRPSDKDLKALLDPTAKPSELLRMARQIIEKHR